MRQLRNLLIFLLCLGGAVAAVNVFAGASFHGGGLTFATQIRLLAPGETRLSLPPLGMAAARTHRAPVRIQLELRGFNPSLIEELSTKPDAKARVLADTTDLARKAALKTALFAILLAGLGALTPAIILRRGRPWFLLASFLFGSSFGGALLSWTYLDYNLEAFNQPRYEGVLESAPWVMSILTDSLDGLQRLGQGFEVMAENLPRLSQGRAGTPMAEIGEDLRVLHVSDIHNNRAAYDLIASLVKNFSVDLVIDTGDLTDYGTPFESELADRIGQLQVPYVFIPGNHDSPEVAARLRRLRNVQVILEARLVRAAGLRILGQPDPSAQAQTPGVSDDDLLLRSAETIARTWEEAPVKPDVVAAHNFKTLALLIGRAPVLLHGHDHRASLRQVGESLIEDAGTSGAAGLRGLAVKDEVPYTLDLQYWRKDIAGRFSLAAVDAISVDGLQGTLQVARTMVKARTDGHE